MTEATTKESVEDENQFELPVKRVTGDTVEERLTENAYERILPARYLLKDEEGNTTETPEELFERVARNVAQPDREHEDVDYEDSWNEYFELMSNLKFMPNSPTLMNAGAELQQLSACFVVHPEDDMDSIFNKVHDAAKIFQSGGGMGYPFHLMRPKGDIVKSTGGIASGPLSFQQVFDTMCGTIKQGGKRRGAQMGIMRVDHPDILRFIVSKRKEGNLANFNISVGLTENFMEAVKNDEEYELENPRTGETFEVSRKTAQFYNRDEDWYPVAAGSDQGKDENFWRDHAASFGDEIEEFDIDLEPGEPMKLPARFIWETLVDGAWRNGEPGLFMYDETNETHSFDVEKHPEHRIEATNPCVTGDTRISTGQGIFTAEELYDQRVGTEVVTDSRISEEKVKEASSVYKTGTKDVFKLETEQGFDLRLTADHRVMTEEGWREAQNLEEGDRVHVLDRAGEFGEGGTREEGEVLGWLVGDGQMKKSEERAVLHFYDGDTEISSDFAGKVNSIVREPEGNANYEIGVQKVQRREGHRQVAEAREERVRSERLYELAEQYGLDEEKLQVPDQLFRSSREEAAGFLSGLFTADGSVQGSTEKGVQVRLSSSDLDLLKQVQQLLLNFGIYSKIYENRRDKGKREMPDGKGGTKEYEVRAQHDLAIAKGEIIKFREEIGFLVDEKSQKLDEKLSQYERGPYSQKRLATVEKVEKDGHEDVYDLTEPDTSSFVANGLVVHNCGEQPLENYEACNLGHVNLSLMVENRKDGAALQFDDWKSENEIEYESEEELDAAMEKYLKEALKMDELERVAKVGTRFLDNVVTMSDFPLQEIEDKVSSMRKVGLGLMGFHQMLIQLGIRYGSEESIAAAREIQRLLTRFSVEESHELAEARGAFDEWEDSKWADPTEYPEWFRKYSGGYEAEEFEDGLKLRNHNTTTIAPTGCVKEDTLISTEDGLEEISDFQGTRINQKWSETSTTEVKSDEGTVEATRHFDNGRVDVQKIKTEEGFEVTATPDHKFRVVDSNGNYAWRETQKIKDGDRVVLQRGTMETEIVETELDTSERENFYRNTDEKLELPSRISENLAEFLGYFMGDGYVHEEVGVKLVVDARQEELEKHLKELGEKVFGVRPTVEDRDSRKMLAFGGRHLPRYFEDNGWKKESGNEGEGAASAFIPEQVLSSGQRPAKAFLRGLFEADGTCPRKVELSTVSEHLARQVQNLLLSLGVVFKREALEAEKLGENHKGDRDRHIVRGLNRREDKLFLEDIGFITKTPDQEIELTSRSYRKDDFPSVMVEELTGAEGFDELDQSLKHKVRQSRYQSLTKKTAEEVVAEVETEDLKVKKFIENDFFLGTVESKQEGVARTHDLEIPENHTYVANGFITHNTTSMIGNTSGGCEPIYQVAYFKNVAKDIQGEDMLVEFDDYFLKALRANDVDVERVKAEVEDLMENNEWEGVQSLDDEVLPPRVKQIFVTSGDITAEEHVDIQAAFQEYNHSGISKTINFDHSATKEDVREAYMRAYEKGVKGMTVYRDGTRDVQVMQQNKENTLTDMDKVDALAEIADDFDSKEELLHSDELKEALGLEEARIEVGKSEDGLEQEVTQEGIEASSAGPGDHTSMGGSSGVKERPKVAKGTTQEIETAYGDLFVTINDSEDNGPFEVFANLGKSGGYTQSFTQALGRMTSLALRSGATGKDVIKQLDDIRSPQIAWDEGTQIHSVPDAIAEAMKRHISQHDGSQQTFDRFDSGNDTRNVGKTEKEEQADAAAIVADGDNPECPECGGMLELSEGCQKCPSCGWSKC